MHANNETGVIQPLREISEICRAARRSSAQRYGAIVWKTRRHPERESRDPVAKTSR